MLSEDHKDVIAVVLVAIFFSVVIGLAFVSVGVLIYYQPIPISIAVGVVALFAALLWAGDRCDKIMASKLNPNE